ncbi:MAG: CBS domain-containing protein [Gemmatimonadota bacterium]|nr:MAG: CBS domain-containing protein [Gemmatimonadota bacterium]
MTAWILVAAGALVAGLGMLAAVAAGAVRRVELYRWAARGKPGGGAAGVLLAAPGRIVRTAQGLVTGGALLAGFGLAALTARLPAPLGAAAILLVGIPAVLAACYSVPRVAGRRWPEGVLRRMVPWLGRIGVLFAPFAPRAPQSRGRAALDQGLQPARADEPDDGAELPELSGILAFIERPVREVMTPRTEIVAVREGTSVEDVGRVFTESGYSRLPIYSESLDNIRGMIYAFDLLKITPGAELPLRPVTTAPGSKRCSDLLFEMQGERHQVAVVLDEYGGTAGVVTFDDLLRELVSDLFGEQTVRAGERSAAPELVEATGATPTDDIAARFDVELPADTETLGGLLAQAAGRIPQTGERYALGGLEFDVLEATPTRLVRVLVRRGPVRTISLGGGA